MAGKNKNFRCHMKDVKTMKWYFVSALKENTQKFNLSDSLHFHTRE